VKTAQIFFSVFVISNFAAANEQVLGVWEVEGTQQAARSYIGGRSYNYPLPTVVTIESSLDRSHQFFATWQADSEALKIHQKLNFWCDGSETKFRCLGRPPFQASSFELEFLSPNSAEIQNAVISFATSGYTKTHTMVKGASKYLKIPADLYTSLEKHASEEKVSVDQWATNTLKGFTDLMNLPGAKGKGATYIIDQSRNYYGDKK